MARPLIAEAQHERPGIRYQIKVIDDPAQINAFAVPGGFLYVYSGLLLVASDEAEVVGVLGHEIGHIVGRHSANSSPLNSASSYWPDSPSARIPTNSAKSPPN